MTLFINLLKWIYRKPQQYVIRIGSKLFGSDLMTDPMGKVVIISPHPDDEVFGCTGLISTLKNQGSSVCIIFLSKGEGIAKGWDNPEVVIDKRRELSQIALAKLGLKSDSIFYLCFKDCDFKNTNHLEFEKLKFLIDKLNPDTIFYPHHWDGSPDHEFASNRVKDLIRNLNIQKYEYSVWLWFHTRLWKTFILDYRNCLRLEVERKLKKEVSDIYATAKDENGFYYSGKLPKLFLEAVNWKYELFFKV